MVGVRRPALALWGANWVTGAGERSILEAGREASTSPSVSPVSSVDKAKINLSWQRKTI